MQRTTLQATVYSGDRYRRGDARRLHCTLVEEAAQHLGFISADDRRFQPVVPEIPANTQRNDLIGKSANVEQRISRSTAAGHFVIVSLTLFLNTTELP
jgi:hypothetical protein